MRESGEYDFEQVSSRNMKPKAGNMDFLGSPASNAGDMFHEIWMLRKALELLDPGSRLVCLTVETGEESRRKYGKESESC